MQIGNVYIRLKGTPRLAAAVLRRDPFDWGCRVKLKTILLGAASALVALPAFGADQNITTTVTSPVSTSVQSGNITISSTGSVAVTGQTIPDGETFPTAAVTIDSNHSVTNSGTISAKAARKAKRLR